MSKPILTYFNGKGKAEVARMIFVEAGVEYTDNRVNDIAALKDKLPFGQVPSLEVDGKILVQSVAINQYLAKRYGFDGKSDWESAEASMIAHGVEDVMSARYQAKTDEQKLEFANQTLPKWLGYFERILKSNDEGKGFIVGKDFTYADLYLLIAIDAIGTLFPGSLDNFPLLKAHKERIASRPKIAQWIQVRPVTPF